MTHTSMDFAPRVHPKVGAAAEEPVVVGSKPFADGEGPVAVASWLAARENRELQVVSVMEPHESMALAAGIPPLPAQYYEAERAAAAARLHDNVAKAAGPALRFRTDVIDGPGARAIAELAHDRNAHVIVIGTGKHDSPGRFVYGERAMQVLRLADRPVLIVPRTALPGSFMHAVVAVDFSATSLRAAAAALPLIERGGRLTLVHVRTTAPTSESNTSTATHALQLSTDDLFRRFLRLLAPSPDLFVDTRVLWGDSVEEIDEFARASGAGLIACGRRRHHSIVERLFVGTVSSGLVRRAACPVLVVPEVDDAAADHTSSMLTGVEAWVESEWPRRVAAFESRNRNHRVRLAVAMNDGLHDGFVAQGYRLQSIRNAHTGGMEVTIGDHRAGQQSLTLCYSAVTNMTLYSDVEGNDLRLQFRSEAGIATLTVAAADLP